MLVSIRRNGRRMYNEMARPMLPVMDIKTYEEQDQLQTPRLIRQDVRVGLSGESSLTPTGSLSSKALAGLVSCEI